MRRLLSKVPASAIEFCNSGLNLGTGQLRHCRLKSTVSNNSYIPVSFLFTICVKTRLRSPGVSR